MFCSSKRAAISDGRPCAGRETSKRTGRTPDDVVDELGVVLEVTEEQVEVEGEVVLVFDVLVFVAAAAAARAKFATTD